jgi:hypothetical protein
MNYMTGKINLDKVDQSRIYQGKKGNYLNVVMFPKTSEPGTWLIKQSLTKEERESGVQLEILGDMSEPQAKVEKGVFDSGPMQSKPVMPKNEHPKPDDDFDPPF